MATQYAYSVWFSGDDSMVFIALYQTFAGAQNEIVRLGTELSKSPIGLSKDGYRFYASKYSTYVIKKVVMRSDGVPSSSNERVPAGHFV